MKKTLFSIPGNYKKLIIRSAVFVFCLILSKSLCSQNQLDYKGIFGERYNEAILYLSAEKWMDEMLIQENINPCFAKAIIFPEVIRYSVLKDKMELQGLFTLYVQYGSNYANFSVGRFQMKPTFAELIEKDINTNLGIKPEKYAIDTLFTSSSRLTRIKRLESPRWQVQYLIWFIRLMDKKYPEGNWNSNSEKLVFYATAYNCGYTNTKTYINEMRKRQLFHTSLFDTGTKYNYADICLSYLKKCKTN